MLLLTDSILAQLTISCMCVKQFHFDFILTMRFYCSFVSRAAPICQALIRQIDIGSSKRC